MSLRETNQTIATFHRPPPPPGQQLLAKLGKMCWVMIEIWLDSIHFILKAYNEVVF